MLQVGEAEKELGGPGATNPYARLVDEAEGLDKIEELQNHTNEDIYEKVRGHKCTQSGCLRSSPCGFDNASIWAQPVLNVTAHILQVVAIMETFFDVEDGEVENLAPQV